LKKIKNGFKRKPRLGTEKYLKKYHAEGFRKGSGITKKIVNTVLKKRNI
jgi:hypothetical protein